MNKTNSRFVHWNLTMHTNKSSAVLNSIFNKSFIKHRNNCFFEWPAEVTKWRSLLLPLSSHCSVICVVHCCSYAVFLLLVASLSLSIELYIMVSKSKQVTESSGNWFIHSIYSIHAMECSEPVIKRLIYWTGFHFFLSRVCVHYCGPNLYSLKYLLYHFEIHLCLLIVNDWNKLFSRMDVIHTHSQT